MEKLHSYIKIFKEKISISLALILVLILRYALISLKLENYIGKYNTLISLL